MYKDMAEKLNYYKEKVIQGFVDRGIYPNDERIENLIQSIDLGLPYLRMQEAKTGEEFNCEVYNAMVHSIYRDLELLYRLLNQLSIQEYVKLKSFIDTHIDDLERKVKMYKDKATQEANSTSLGKTILFKNSNYNIKINNTLQTIDLGTISVHKGSRIACYLNADEIEGDKCIFTLTDIKGETISTSPFNYNQNSILIPGSLNINEYDYKMNEDQKIDGLIKIDINNKINSNNKYIVLAEKNKVLVKQFGENSNQQFVNKPTSYDMLGFSDKAYIDFYTVGTTSINFHFNKKPINTNFSLDNYQVNNLDYIHHFFIEGDEGFAFDFEINSGEVYAIKSNPLIMNKELYFPKLVESKDFHVVEYEVGDPIAYQCKAEIINDDAEPIKINSIMIKEIMQMEDATL